jgi:hypothetical protein
VNSKEEKAFRDIFNYIPLKTIDGAVEMEDIDVKAPILITSHFGDRRQYYARGSCSFHKPTGHGIC